MNSQAPLAYNISTKIPPNFVDSFDAPTELHQASTYGLNQDRDSNIAWLAASHWLVAWVQAYMTTMNNTYFCYDLTGIDAGNAQYTEYTKEQYFKWHTDAEANLINMMIDPIMPGQGMSIDTVVQSEANKAQYIRKLSFTLQLSHPDEYEGGELQLLYNHKDLITTPKEYGMLTIFDSRIPHRVRKIKSGMRKSLVGWMVGPRWK
jgi:predicted 2-oxoglutarate/Fe(II)-dependent dioxygenase YbiX